MTDLTTYDGLKAGIAEWLNREDLTAQIPAFISLAEATFNRNIRHHKMIGRVTALMTDEYSPLPDDWLETITFMSVSNPPCELEYVRNADMNALRATQRTGATFAYTLIGSDIYIFPTPDVDGVDVEMIYYKRITPLAADNQSNWLLATSPDIYLFAALLMAEPYLKNDERLATWGTMLAQLMESLKLETERAKRPEGGMTARRRTFG